MIKTYLENGRVHFYEKGIEIRGIVYGVRGNRDIERIRRSAAGDEDIDSVTYTEVVFEQPTAEQLEKIQTKRFENPIEARKFVDEVLSGTYMPTQDEINAAIMLEIAKIKAGV